MPFHAVWSEPSISHVPFYRTFTPSSPHLHSLLPANVDNAQHTAGLLVSRTPVSRRFARMKIASLLRCVSLPCTFSGTCNSENPPLVINSLGQTTLCACACSRLPCSRGISISVEANSRLTSFSCVHRPFKRISRVTNCKVHLQHWLLYRTRIRRGGH